MGTREMIKESWNECGADPNSNFVNMEISDDHAAIFPEFSRDTGAEILGLIQDVSDLNYVENEYSFLKDGAFCEYAYLLDLDKLTVTVYVSGKSYKTYHFKDFTEKAMILLEKDLKY